jgi:glycosyltransferase involved in cell wall biosynthesis
VRVLILHSRYLSGDASGENRVVEDEAKLLSDGGHDVTRWTPSPDDVRGLGLARTAVSAVWSRRAVAAVRTMVRERRVEIVHCHNLLPTLSPAVLRAADDAGAAVVMTLHNYRLMCLPSTFLRDGRVCEDCLGRLPWPGVVHGCYRDSRAGSAVVATALAAHRTLGSFAKVSRFLAVSPFVRDRHVAAGLPASRIEVKSNFSWPSRTREGPGGTFLYLGRISAEKGLATLLEAWHRGASGRLLVVGDGPERASLERTAPDGVTFLGQVSADRVGALLLGARAVLVPSVWYEAQPRVILESFAAGIPVAVSRIGGLPDLVEDGVTGLVLTPGDPDAWAAGIRTLANDEVVTRMGNAARDRWAEAYSPARALPALEHAYRTAIRDRER